MTTYASPTKVNSKASTVYIGNCIVLRFVNTWFIQVCTRNARGLLARQRAARSVRASSASQREKTSGTQGNRFDDLLFKDFSKTFQGLLTIFTTGTISHFCHSKTTIPVSANNVKQPKERLHRIITSTFPAWNLNFCPRNKIIKLNCQYSLLL